MRKQFVKTIEDLMAQDDRLVLLMGDIGVYGFRNAFRLYPERTYNIGICEQAMTSLAAGLAKEGFIPVLHSIAPFVVERCLEQLKIDLCYQNLPANIVSVGASYDYAALGCTHHCPADVAVLRALPGMEIVIPGTAAEFDELFRAAYANSHPTYFRLSERSNQTSYDVKFGWAEVVRRGSLGAVIAVGPALTWVEEATQEFDVTVLYYTTIAPFDKDTLMENCPSGKIAVVEPFHEGTLAYDITSAMKGRDVSLLSIGVPREFLTNYGHTGDHDLACSLTPHQIKPRLEQFFYG
jgi:transketolase